MALLTRIEFIGLDSEGNTVLGHKFDTSSENVRQWLSENGINQAIIELCGYLPVDDLWLTFEEVQALYNMREFRHNRAAALRALNRMAREIYLGGER